MLRPRAAARYCTRAGRPASSRVEDRRFLHVLRPSRVRREVGGEVEAVERVGLHVDLLVCLVGHGPICNHTRRSRRCGGRGGNLPWRAAHTPARPIGSMGTSTPKGSHAAVAAAIARQARNSTRKSRRTARGRRALEEEEIGDGDVVTAGAARHRDRERVDERDRWRRRRGATRPRSRRPRSRRRSSIAAGIAVTANSDVGDPSRDQDGSPGPASDVGIGASTGRVTSAVRGPRGRRRPSAPGARRGGRTRTPRPRGRAPRCPIRARSSASSTSRAIATAHLTRRSGRRRRNRWCRRRPPRASRRSGPPPPGPRARRPRGTRCRTPPLRARAIGRGTASRTRPRSRAAAPEPVVGHAAEEARPAPSPRFAARASSRRRSRPPPAIASCTSGKPGDRVDEHVESLPRHQPAHPDDERPLVVEPERLPHREALARRRWAGSDRRRRRAGRRHRGAGGARRGPLRARSTRSRRRRPRRGAARARRGARDAGQAAGHGHLRAVHDDDVRRRAQARSELAERQPRVEEDHRRTDLARRAHRCGARATAWGRTATRAHERHGTGGPRPTPCRRRSSW